MPHDRRRTPVSVGIRRPHQAVDYDDLVRLFQPAPEYFEHGWLAPPEEIERTQLVRLKERLEAAPADFRAPGVEQVGVQGAHGHRLFFHERRPMPVPAAMPDPRGGRC